MIVSLFLNMTSSSLLRFPFKVAVWYDAEGRDPHYFPPSVEEVNDGRMVHRGSYQQYVAMHLQVCSLLLLSHLFSADNTSSNVEQEFAENSADFQHFQPLHGQVHVLPLNVMDVLNCMVLQMHVPFTEIPIPGLTIQHSADWYTGEGDERWRGLPLCILLFYF